MPTLLECQPIFMPLMMLIPTADSIYSQQHRQTISQEVFKPTQTMIQTIAVRLLILIQPQQLTATTQELT